MMPGRKQSRRNSVKRRSLHAERLESRRLMAADVLLHNAALPTDVNGDGIVSASDALAVINFMALARPGEGESFLASGIDTSAPAESTAAADVALTQLDEEARLHNALPLDDVDGPSQAADVGSPSKMVDVDNNGIVTASDALIVINHLQSEGEMPADTPRPSPLDYSLFPKASDVDGDSDATLKLDVLKNFKTLDPDNPDFTYTSVFNDAVREDRAANQLTTDEVNTLLERASAATRSSDAIIAVVDRSGRILGVRVEEDVNAELKVDKTALAFAIDGAVAKARTAAFFSSNAAPITSRTIRSLSQSTMVQRVVESSPVATEDNYKGPGFVAPIGVGGKFPPEVNFTPQVDLFAIEHQSRDSQRNAGPDQIKGNEDDFYLRTRFNADPTYIPGNSEQFFQTWPESYGVQTDMSYASQARGIATLPGGVPLYKAVTIDGKPVTSPLSDSFNLVGGIGVFFPGEDGYATHEQGFKHASETGSGQAQSEQSRTNAPKVLEAEFAAFIAAAGKGLVNPFQSAFVRDLSAFNQQLPPLNNFLLPTGRIDLVGITLEIYGPNPTREFRMPGVDRLIQVGQQTFGGTGFISGSLYPINKAGDLLQAGQPVPEGWLVAPHDSKVSGLTAEAVDKIIAQGVADAQRTRAAIRLDIDGGFRPARVPAWYCQLPIRMGNCSAPIACPTRRSSRSTSPLQSLATPLTTPMRSTCRFRTVSTSTTTAPLERSPRPCTISPVIRSTRGQP